jgi:glycosyltransferase 2 family protein
MSKQKDKILKTFSPRRIFIAIFIGISVSAFLVYKQFDASAFAKIDWTATTFFWIFIALSLQALRDIAYMYRLRLLTDKQISWRRSFDVIILWEFASSVTPSIVGGSAVAMFIVHKEGIKLGRSTAVVMITALLDEFFYISMVPIVFLFTGTAVFFSDTIIHLGTMELGSKAIFIIGYFFIVFLTITIVTGVFISPKGFKWVLVKIFSLPFLKKWKNGASRTGDEIISTSKEMKGKPFIFWLKAYLSTFISWTARYWVVNCLILAFVAVDNHFIIYAKQLIMWVILLISPTPGGAGIAEIMFHEYLSVFIPVGLVAALAILWRLMSYYSYLFIGSVILPNWLKRVFVKNETPQ